MPEDQSGPVSERRRARVTDAPPASIAALPRRTFAPGDILMEENSPAGALYFLARGSVEVRKNGVSIAEVGEPGAVFGEMSVLLRTPHTAEVRAAGEVEVHVAEAPESFLREHPEVALYVARILAQRLNALNRYLVDVKRQFGDEDGHLAMVDEVLDTLMNKHPRSIDRRGRRGM